MLSGDYGHEPDGGTLPALPAAAEERPESSSGNTPARTPFGRVFTPSKVDEVIQKITPTRLRQPPGRTPTRTRPATSPPTINTRPGINNHTNAQSKSPDEDRPAWNADFHVNRKDFSKPKPPARSPPARVLGPPILISKAPQLRKSPSSNLPISSRPTSGFASVQPSGPRKGALPANDTVSELSDLVERQRMQLSMQQDEIAAKGALIEHLKQRLAEARENMQSTKDNFAKTEAELLHAWDQEYEKRKHRYPSSIFKPASFRQRLPSKFWKKSLIFLTLGTRMRTMNFVVYPPPTAQAYGIGDKVFVKLRSDKDTGRATVTGPAGSDGRIPIQYECSQSLTFNANPKRIVHIIPSGVDTTIIICATTTEYRLLARSQVQKEDRVADIGSSYGMSTDILSQHSNDVIGLEISKTLVVEARKRFPKIHFEQIDILENEDRAQTVLGGRNKMFVDVGGDRAWESLVPIVEFLCAKMKPELIVIKNEQLHEQALLAEQGPDGRLVNGSDWWCALKAQCTLRSSERAASWFIKGKEEGFSDNPLKYGPVRLTREGIPICKVQNYSSQGCQKIALCRYDHEHCDHCGKRGHFGLNCTLI
ncbi:hypothetical protein DFS34DRAFT_597987 [Phlyctochytrium arcticum]|nr:hypothetical protein DFS34DRAFT_597987 [Phlyctochytrium arcticum]